MCDCQVSKQLEQAESDKRASEGELERKGRELFKTQVSIPSQCKPHTLVLDEPGGHHEDPGGGGEGAG